MPTKYIMRYRYIPVGSLVMHELYTIHLALVKNKNKNIKENKVDYNNLKCFLYAGRKFLFNKCIAKEIF